MNESTLNALINLFAVFTIKGGTDFDTARSNLGEYLTNQLGIRSTGDYQGLFFELFDLYSSGVLKMDDENTRKITIKVCNQIKGRIHHAEQLMIFLHFLELARLDSWTTDHLIYDLVAEIFEITPKDYQAFKQFIFSRNPQEIETEGFLVIDQHRKANASTVLHIRKENLDGTILFYYVSDTGQFIFRYFGHESLQLEGNNIRPGQFHNLNPGGIIRGKLDTNIYYTEVSAAFFQLSTNAPLVFSAHDISFTFPGSTNGIHPFRFSEPSGQLIAVMGGSGVGKSTLLNVLNGNLPLKTGTITINGVDIHKEFDRIEGQIGYIPQDDLVMEELTVYQNLYFNALLCLDQLSEEEIQSRIDRVLENLSLSEVRDMVVGNPLKKLLSGGQRKRLNIGLELIREPSILFVDEPTSGLSSRDSEKIMVLLKQLTQQGKLIIVNIHQPSSFIYKLFDKLWIFDKGGYPVYAGNPLDGISYFKRLDKHIDADNCECSACGNVNPEQVLDIIETVRFDDSGRVTSQRKYSPKELYRLYLDHIQGESAREIPPESPLPPANFYKPPRHRQFRIYFARNFRSKISNVQYIVMNLLQSPILALVVGFLTRYSTPEGYTFGENKNFPSFIFMSVIVMLFQGMSLSAEEIIRDRKILQREAFLRLSRLSYLNSKIVFLVAVSLFQSFLYILVGSLVLQIHGLFLQYWAILFLTAVMANLTGLNISSGLNSVVTIYITIPLLIIPQILLSGLIVRFDDMRGAASRHNSVPLIGDLMVSRWSFEALAVEQFMYNAYNVHFYDIDREISDDIIKGEFLIPVIQNALSFYRLPGMTAKRDPDALKAAVRGMKDLDRDSLLTPFGLYANLSSGQPDPKAADSAIRRLDSLRAIYKSLYINAERQKDAITDQLSAELGPDGTNRLKDRHQNASLANLVTNRDIGDEVIRAGDRFLVKVAPIYRLPERRDGRAQFYAPAKILGPFQISTYYFNMGMIGLMILFLYVALYFDWLKKLLEGSGKLRKKL
jgi:ABC-type multidrug transport system ATPase subunit